MSGQTICRKYEEILQYVKNQGVKVYHRSFTKDRQGNYETNGCYIVIQSSIWGTIDGCYALAHEFAHWQQHRAGEFKDFFTNMRYSKRALNLVYKAEQDASKRAKRLLWFYNIRYSPGELDPSRKQEYLEFYRANYFTD